MLLSLNRAASYFSLSFGVKWVISSSGEDVPRSSMAFVSEYLLQ